MQGYHGSSHQNQDSLWQYDVLASIWRRVDGNTAGQPINSPVNGVVRWTDPSTGGISIDIGNGHAVAMFHVTFIGGLEAGTPVQQGQLLGEISGPGGPGFMGTAHVHFTLWETSDNGNWDRHAEPFTGQYTISGMDFPDTGGGGHLRGHAVQSVGTESGVGKTRCEGEIRGRGMPRPHSFRSSPSGATSSRSSPGQLLTVRRWIQSTWSPRCSSQMWWIQTATESVSPASSSGW